MRLNGNVVFVPDSIYDVVLELGLPKESMLDFDVLSKLLGVDTIASYVAINDFINQGNFVMGTEVNLGDLISYRETLYPYNFEENNKGNRNTKVIIDNALVILNELNGTDNYSGHKVVFSRMLGADIVESNLNKPNYVYELFDIKDEIFGVRLVVSPEEYFSQPLLVLEKSLHLLNKQYKYEELVKTKLFERWCSVTLRNL